eukprot:1157304-Pelagomonas_calceolata.AAC.1
MSGCFSLPTMQAHQVNEAQHASQKPSKQRPGLGTLLGNVEGCRILANKPRRSGRLLVASSPHTHLRSSSAPYGIF